MTSRKCARGWEHDAVREGRLSAADGASFLRHARTCADCRDAVARDDRLRELGRAWPAEAPAELVLRRVRARVLRAAANAPAPVGASGRRRLAVGLALAAGLIGPVVVASLHRGRRSDVAPASASLPAAPMPVATAFAGSVLGAPSARWTQTRAGGLERVHLVAGTVAIHVRPQVAGERFLVELPDGELEVRGTTFQVAVESEVTTRVHVDEGTVELRLRGEPEQALVGGSTWSGAALRVAPVTPAPTAVAGAGRRAPAPPATSLDAYAGAMKLLQAGRAEDAASAFHEFASAHPEAPQAEDASFLEALALARAGRRDAAGLAAEHHLTSFPRSFHRRDAAILVARAASQRGECAAARAVLARWLSPASSPPREAAIPQLESDPDAASALRGCDILPITPGPSPEKAEK
jgi:hypothetical protein